MGYPHLLFFFNIVVYSKYAHVTLIDLPLGVIETSRRMDRRTPWNTTDKHELKYQSAHSLMPHKPARFCLELLCNQQ